MSEGLQTKLIVQLSLFGLAMGVATVYVVPSRIEPLCWLAIFFVCAGVIARRVPRRHFLHGFLVSALNGVWITGAHVILYSDYLARHPDEAAMLTRMPMPDSPRLMMLITGPVIAVISGLVLGTLSWIAGKVLGRGRPVATPEP
jgi:hypothetical protein